MSGERRYLIIRRFLVGAFLVYLGPTTASALVRGRIPRLTDFTGPGAWERVLSAAGMATIIVIFAWFHERRMAKLPRPVLIQRMQRELDQVVGHRWAWRTLLWGVTLGAVITATAGVMVAYVLPGVELIDGSRSVTLAAFFGGTLIWAIPGAFLLRLGLVRYYRRFLRSAS
jgi:hypothetical protein